MSKYWQCLKCKEYNRERVLFKSTECKKCKHPRGYPVEGQQEEKHQLPREEQKPVPEETPDPVLGRLDAILHNQAALYDLMQELLSGSSEGTPEEKKKRGRPKKTQGGSDD